MFMEAVILMTLQIHAAAAPSIHRMKMYDFFHSFSLLVFLLHLECYHLKTHRINKCIYFVKQGDECGSLAEFGNGPNLAVKYSFSNFSFKVS